MSWSRLSFQRAGAGVGHHCYALLRRAPIHDAAVLQDERAAAVRAPSARRLIPKDFLMIGFP